MLIIHRSKPTGNFTILPNELIRDDRLSYCARGVLAELLSRPNGWETNADALSERARRHRDGRGEGRRAMRAAFAELEDAGYMVRHKRKGEKGRFVTVLELYDTPDDRGTARGTSADGTSVGGTSVSGTSSRSSDLGSTDDEDLGSNTLSPAVPAPRNEPDPEHEREKPPSFEDHQTTDSLPGIDAYAAQLADADAVPRVTASWTEAYKRSSNGSEPSARAVARVRASAASRLRAGQTADDLVLIAADMAETNLAWTDLAEHEAHWLHKQQHSLSGTDATVSGWMDLSRQLGGRQHTPYSNSGWDRIAQLAAAGERPDGWERVPHCGHPDCDEITRQRRYGDETSCCSDCHPQMQFL